MFTCVKFGLFFAFFSCFFFFFFFFFSCFFFFFFFAFHLNFAGVPIMPQRMYAGLVALRFFVGSGSELLRNPIFCDFSGEVRTPCAPLDLRMDFGLKGTDTHAPVKWPGSDWSSCFFLVP